MTAANLGWEWPDKVLRLFPEPCDRYYCKFDAYRGYDPLAVNDVTRCRGHRRLLVVASVNFSSDSNGGTHYTRMKRLRPWRLGYWRARHMIPKATP